MPPKRVARPVDPSILSTDSYGQPPAQVYDQQQQPAYFDPSNPHQGQQPAYGGQPAYQQQQQQQHPQAHIQQQQQQYHQQDQQYQQGYPAQAYPANPIAQPPHSTGRPARGGAGGRPQLDPSLVPSPISLLAHAQQYNDSQNAGSWSSALEGGPPGAQVDFRAVDEGASTPTFIRSSLTAVPTTADLLRSSQLPFGIHVTPFAEPLFGEAPIPVIDPGEEGPERCRNCKGYLSSLCHWEGGGRWRCNLCGTTNTSACGRPDRIGPESLTAY
jgi:protein transport protein SEC24